MTKARRTKKYPQNKIDQISGLEHRFCPTCGYRPLTRFYRRGMGYHRYCKSCRNEATYQWQRDNKEAYAAYQRTRYARRKAAKTT